MYSLISTNKKKESNLINANQYFFVGLCHTGNENVEKHNDKENVIEEI